MHEFELIEDAVITALTPLLSNGLKTLEAYSGQLDVEEVSEITLRWPCIYVIASGLEAHAVNRADRIEAELTLFVGDRNLRGSAHAARGDASSPGVYALLEMAREKLHRKKLLDGWTPFVRAREEPVVYEPKENICLYAATYRSQK